MFLPCELAVVNGKMIMRQIDEGQASQSKQASGSAASWLCLWLALGTPAAVPSMSLAPSVPFLQLMPWVFLEFTLSC